MWMWTKENRSERLFEGFTAAFKVIIDCDSAKTHWNSTRDVVGDKSQVRKAATSPLFLSGSFLEIAHVHAALRDCLYANQLTPTSKSLQPSLRPAISQPSY